MKHAIYSIAILVFLLTTCKGPSVKSKEQLKVEITQVERQFKDMAAREGIAKAFIHYAADSAVLKRGEKLIVGKKAITEYFNQPSNNSEIKLIWEPTFIDVSESGDLAYSYGNYTYSFADSIGGYHESEGIFHTVWKRQLSGEWKYVWD